MKYKIITLLLFIPFYSNATIKTSVNDGDWHNSETWSPAGIPFNEDTLIINTNVTTDEDINVLINTLIINEGHTLNGEYVFALHGNLFNYGTINFSTLAIGDGILTLNEGVISGKKLLTSNSLYQNYNTILSDSLITSNPTFQNLGFIDNIFTSNSDLFINTGHISDQSQKLGRNLT